MDSETDSVELVPSSEDRCITLLNDEKLNPYPRSNGENSSMNCDGEQKVVPRTALGDAVDNLISTWNQLISHIVADVGHVQPTVDHVKENAEYSVRQFKDACLETGGEFTRVAMEWRISHPNEVRNEEIADLEAAITRQRVLIASLKERIGEREGEKRMWHEARRQEKIIKTSMVDSAKRHERRRTFYESIRKDPAEFMQIHGRRMQINVDSSKTTTDQSLLRKWQGDPEVLIDRFDVRAHLDYIPPDTSNRRTVGEGRLKDDVEELQCNFERYRILALNDFLKITEAKHLQQIDARELCQSLSSITAHKSIHKTELEKKKKLADKKAAIAFAYAGTETVAGADSSIRNPSGEHASDDGEGEDDLENNVADDVAVDVEKLGSEQAAQLNKIGARYNVGQGVFCKMVSLDKKEQLESAELKEIDRAKLALSGREAKADRALLKRRRKLIIGRGVTNEEATTSLLSFLANMRKAEANNELGSSSESDERGRGRIEFISSMARSKSVSETLVDDASRSKGGPVQGPVLPPPEYRRLLELRRNRSPETDGDNLESRPDSSKLFYRARSRSRERRQRRSRSRSVRRRRRRQTSHSSSRSSSSGRHRSKRRRHSRRSRDSKKRRQNTRRDTGKGREAKLEERRKDPPSSTLIELRADATSGDEETLSGPESERSIHSSMSDSEKEKIERDNRRIRMRRVKRKLKEKETPGISSRKEESGAQRMDVAKKLKGQMQRNLEKTAAKLKAEEAQKFKEQVQQRRRREDELFEESRLRRRRERDRRRKEEERNEKDRKSSDEEDKGWRPKRRYRRRSPSTSALSESSG